MEVDRLILGVLDQTAKAIRTTNPPASNVDDMLDDLAELVMAEGGEVIIVPKERMLTDSDLAAIYRF